MIVAYIFSGLWFIGITVAYCWGFKEAVWSDDWDWSKDVPSQKISYLGAALMICLALPVALFVALLPWPFIAEARSPDLVTLKKNAWQCVQSHQEVQHGGYMAGKVWIPTTTVVNVCDLYGKK